MDKRKIWIDTDLSVGMIRSKKEGYCDVDDGYAILQIMKSTKVDIHGMSAVFGNTDIDNAYRLCNYMVDQFYHSAIPVYKGAGGEMNKSKIQTNEAVEALAEALKTTRMTILAIGPATNIGLLLALYPEVADNIEEVVLVAGRRKPTDAFNIGNKGLLAMDLNFDLDNDAFQVLLQSGVKTVLCPFEISSKVWIVAEDLKALAQEDDGCKWLAEYSEAWLDQWKEQDAHGFNPFDVLASHYILYPDDIIKEDLFAKLELYEDDTKAENNKETYKAYLLCNQEKGYPVTYCYDVVEDYHERLLTTFKS